MRLDTQVVQSDAQVFARIAKPTLFYLPHCAASLSHNLLAANWEAGALPKLALIANSFGVISERWNGPPSTRPSSDLPRPEAVLKLIEENAVVDAPVMERNFPVCGAFNDTSVMLFPATFQFDRQTVQPLALEYSADG